MSITETSLQRLRMELLLHLDEQRTSGEVHVGEHGVVPLDLDVVLPRG